MKLVLQAFEPMPHPFGNSNASPDVQTVTPRFRKSRIRLNSIVIDSRLFHAL